MRRLNVKYMERMWKVMSEHEFLRVVNTHINGQCEIVDLEGKRILVVRITGLPSMGFEFTGYAMNLELLLRSIKCKICRMFIDEKIVYDKDGYLCNGKFRGE